MRISKGLLVATLTWLVATLTWLIVQLPTLAHACSVCTAGRDEENQTAFLLSTLFMSLLPLVALGTLLFVLWRRFKKLESSNTVPASTTAPRKAHTAH